MTWRVIHADCIEAMRGMDEASVDAIVTDPPYGLGFMGKDWDTLAAEASRPPSAERLAADGRDPYPRTGKGPAAVLFDGPGMQMWHRRWAYSALRVLKPGAHLLAFGGTRTYHRLACALEDAGFEIRDCLAWLYGSGFPKSLDVSKAIDKAAGAAREVVGVGPYEARRPTSRRTIDGGEPGPPLHYGDGHDLTAPATPEAERWQGWGTALKPAFEPIVLARKPLVGSVATNVERFGTGALNIDGARIGFASEADRASAEALGELRAKGRRLGVLGEPGQGAAFQAAVSGDSRTGDEPIATHPEGRWPANVVLDPEAAAMLDAQTGDIKGQVGMRKTEGGHRFITGDLDTVQKFERGTSDTGGASRFFYVSKVSAEERNRGLDERNVHPTLKPVQLMQWLCRLVTPPGGLILDPFVGSGSTGMAALREGFDFIGVEREADYVEIARARIQGDAPLFNVQTEVTA